MRLKCGWSRVAAVFAIAAASGLFGGCAGVVGPSKSELASAEYGQPVTQQAAEEQARGFLQRQGADLARSNLTFDPVESGYARDERVGGPYDFGYRLYATLDEKDAAGYFKGPVNYVFMFGDGRMKSVYRVLGIKADLWDWKPRLVRIH